MKILGIQHNTTTSYHPQANGKIERFHRHIKDGIRARLNGDKNWLGQLPWVLLGQRTTPNSDTGIAPALLVYGQHPDLPGPIVRPKDDITSYQQYSQQLATVMNQLEFTTVPCTVSFHHHATVLL